MSAQKAAAAALVVVAAAAVAAALWITGGPAAQRALRLDAQRVMELRTLSSALDRYYRAHGALPGTLEPLVDGLALTRVPRDPGSGKPYRYRALGGTRFELCATFVRRSRDEPPGDFWFHEAGERCFSFDATQPERP